MAGSTELERRIDEFVRELPESDEPLITQIQGYSSLPVLWEFPRPRSGSAGAKRGYRLGRITRAKRWAFSNASSLLSMFVRSQPLRPR